jgi:hypothetical protein
MSSLITKDFVFKVLDLNTKMEECFKKIQKKCFHKVIFGKHHSDNIDENFDYYICPSCGKRDTSFGYGGWNLNVKEVKWISREVFNSFFKEKEIVLLSKNTINKIIKNKLEKI